MTSTLCPHSGTPTLISHRRCSTAPHSVTVNTLGPVLPTRRLPWECHLQGRLVNHCGGLLVEGTARAFVVVVFDGLVAQFSQFEATFDACPYRPKELVGIE